MLRKYYTKKEQRDVTKRRHHYTKRRSETLESSRNSYYKKRFGITVLDYERMLKAQNGVCVICGHVPKKIRLAIEHDHATGRVRGLACFRCNKFLIGKHTVETAKKVYEYLLRKKALGL